MTRKSSLILLYFVFLLFNLQLKTSCSAQSVNLNLREAIDSARKRSLEFKIAQNTLRSSYWNYRYYQAGYLPKLALTGTLPDYYNTINSITLPDGQNTFINQNVANSSLNLNLLQNVTLTGGSVSVSSSMMRIDNFGSFRNKAYTTVPFSLSYNQANLFYNDFKWQKKIEPLKFQEAKKAYLEVLEDISSTAVDKYFSLLLSQIQLKLDQQNLSNIDTLLKITQARFNIGTVTLNDILQVKVSLLNAQKSLTTSTLNLKNAEQGFVKFLNFGKNASITLGVPDSVVTFKISPELALEKAKLNRKFVVEYQRRHLAALQEVEKVKSQTGPTFAVKANFGLTQTGPTINAAYADLLRNQSLTLSFYIPLVDWGVNRSNRKRALADLELENNNISQESLAVEQEIYYNVTKWGMQDNIISIARQTNKLAQQRYEIARQKYASGGLSYTDYNNAQLDKDKASVDYINILYDYWRLYYNIRKNTLFDFSQNKTISTEEAIEN